MERRERKKQQTRQALLHAALDLFEVKGYENTAIREITDAVDVSERTFFRYFASKEDLVLSFVTDATTALFDSLKARPANEAPLHALRAAFSESLRSLSDTMGEHDGEPAYLPVLRLIDETPSLLAAHLRYSHEHESEVVGLIARREGVDPDDPRPLLLAAIFGAVCFLASREWRTHGKGGTEALLSVFDRYADHLGPDLFDHWTST